MKKFLLSKYLLMSLLISATTFAQNPTRFAKIQLTGNTTSATATSVNVQEANGEVNTKPLSDFEKTTNKQNSLSIDGTATKYPTVDAVNTNLSGKADKATTLNINGSIQSLSVNRDWRTGMADTGVKTFAGLSTNDATHINIGAVTGQVVDNETTPGTPIYTDVSYAGATGVLVTTVGSGLSSYVMLSSAGVISFQNTFPTSAERKAKIWLGKIGHPTGTITTVGNEPDLILSPLAQHRDLFQAFGYINNGVRVSANGANLSINISQGVITGDGINFVSSRTSPNNVTMGPNVAATFMIRTQTGAGGAGVTAITPGNYDVAGTITAIPGGGGTSSLQYVWAVPPLGYIVTLGQTTYNNLGLAVAAAGKEVPVIYPNLINNAILIGVLAVTKNATDLSNTAQAQFIPVSKIGEITSGASGTTTNTAKITITTAVSITSATMDANGVGQDAKHVVIDNGVNPINITCNGGVTTTYGKVGTGAITFIQGAGRTLVTLSGTAVLNGVVGSIAAIWSNGTTDYLSITNY